MKGKRPLTVLMIAVLAVGMLAALPGAAMAGDDCDVDQDNDQKQGAAVIQDSFDFNGLSAFSDSGDTNVAVVGQSQTAYNDGEIDECDD